MKINKQRDNIILIMCATLLTTCTSDGYILGRKFLDNNVRTVIIDTCAVKMYTIAIDSVVTSGKSSVLLGSYSDTTMGHIVCTAYLAFTVPGEQNLPEATIVFDSVDLVMSLNGKWLGDTTRYHTFNIYPLAEVIDLPDDEEFYSTHQVVFGSVPLTTFSIRPKPLTGNDVSVRLPDRIGSDLLQKIMDEDETTLGSQDRFMNYLNGFAITSGEGNNNILGFKLSDTSMVMRIHYHYSTWERTKDVITITPFQERCFYGVTSDRTGTPFENLKSNELLSSKTDNMVLVQALTASYVKIEFPHLNNLLELGDFCTVISADLIIYPVKGTYSSSNPLPSDLSMYISDENDVTQGYITTYSGDALQTGDLVTDELYGIETYYTYNISSFIEDQLGAIGIYRKSLQFIVSQDNLAVTLNTLVAGDASHPRNKIKLKISYLIYDGK
jgi:hypothetical protein